MIRNNITDVALRKEVHAAWADCSSNLATWVFDHLVNRTDAWGQYYGPEDRDRGNATTQKGTLEAYLLVTHFRSANHTGLVGLHSTSKNNTSKWLAIDIDRHEGDGANAEANEQAGLALYGRCVELGFEPLLMDSNGRGGFHLMLLFDEPTETRIVYAFGQFLIRDYKDLGLVREPETFPKQAELSLTKKYGNWLRLPGQHHTYDHFTKVWSGEKWLVGQAAIDRILSTNGQAMPQKLMDSLVGVQVAVDAATPREKGAGRLARSTKEFLERGAPAGERNDRLFRAAADLKGNGYSRAEIMEKAGAAAISAGLSQTEVEKTVGSVVSQPRSPAVPSSDDALSQPSRPYVPFPADALPDAIREYVSDSSQAIGCDPALVAAPVLAVLSVCVGNSHVIELKPDWHEPGVLWTVIVTPSGAHKSPALDAALQPLNDWQEREFHEYEKRQAQHEHELQRYEIQMAGLRKKGTTDGEDLPEKPDPPTCSRILCGDTTVEALVDVLRSNPRGMLVRRDEFAGLLLSCDSYKMRAGGDLKTYLEMYGARPILVDRKTSGHPLIMVSRAFVAMTGGIQPAILRHVLARERFEDGLPARLLFAMPPTKRVHWNDDGVPPGTRDRYRRTCEALLALPVPHDEAGRLTPVSVPLSPDAKRVWTQYYDQHGASEYARPDGKIKTAMPKLRGAAARIALIIHMATVASENGSAADPLTISESAMKSGIALSRWFENETKWVYAVLDDDPEEKRIRRVLDFVRIKGGEISVRDLCRNQVGGIRKAADAKKTLDELVGRGDGEWHDVPGDKGRGRLASPKFLLLDHPTPDVNEECQETAD